MAELIETIGNTIQQLSIVHQRMSTLFNRRLAASDTTMSQLALLSHLAGRAGQQFTVTELAEALQMNQPATTKIVQQLEVAGAVSVRADPDDARKRRVAISRAGLAKLSKSFAALAPDAQALFQGFTPKEVAGFGAFLQRLAENLRGLE